MKLKIFIFKIDIKIFLQIFSIFLLSIRFSYFHIHHENI